MYDVHAAYVRIVYNFEYKRLKGCIDTQSLVFDDESWLELKNWRELLEQIAAIPDADPYDREKIREEIQNLDILKTQMLGRQARASIDKVNLAVDEITRVQGAMDVLTRIPEFIAMVNNAREIGRRKLDDYTSVMQTLDTFAWRITASSNGMLTPTAARAAGAVLHNIRAYTYVFAGAKYMMDHESNPKLAELVVLKDPMPRARVRELLTALGAWVCNDPGNIERTLPHAPCPVTVEDMLRALAAFSPKCFNLLRKRWSTSLSADDWISATSAHMKTQGLLILFVYLFPQQLFAQNPKIVQQQTEITKILFRALVRSGSTNEGRIRDTLYRIAFVHSERWGEVQLRRTGRYRPLLHMFEDVRYRTIMTTMWIPDLDIPQSYFEKSQIDQITRHMGKLD